MADETNVIGVLRRHLQDTYEILDLIATYFGALDLTESIKSGSPSPKTSRTSQRINRSRDRIAGYLEVEDDVPEE